MTHEKQKGGIATRAGNRSATSAPPLTLVPLDIVTAVANRRLIDHVQSEYDDFDVVGPLRHVFDAAQAVKEWLQQHRCN